MASPSLQDPNPAHPQQTRQLQLLLPAHASRRSLHWKPGMTKTPPRSIMVWYRQPNRRACPMGKAPLTFLALPLHPKSKLENTALPPLLLPWTLRQDLQSPLVPIKNLAFPIRAGQNLPPIPQLPQNRSQPPLWNSLSNPKVTIPL